jgi:hypothetical protein
MYEASAGVEILNAAGDLDGVAALLEYVAQAAEYGTHGEGLLGDPDQEVGHQQRHVLQIGQYGKRQLAHLLFLCLYYYYFVLFVLFIIYFIIS